MTPRDALIELLERVGAQHGAAVLISEAELQRWPPEAVSALRAHQFLTRARPASTVVCPGCEEHCVMPVETIPGGPSGPAQFIVCDKDIDINRVDITPDQLRQWKCDAAAIARFVARCLGLHRSGRRPARSGILEIGLAAGDTRCQMLCLRTDGDATLVVSDRNGATGGTRRLRRRRLHAGHRHDSTTRRFSDDRRPALHAEHGPARGAKARHGGEVRKLGGGIPCAETASPSYVRRVVCRTDCEAGGRCRMLSGNHPQAHEGVRKLGGKIAPNQCPSISLIP